MVSYNTGAILYFIFSFIFFILFVITLFVFIPHYQINFNLTDIWKDIFNNNSTNNHLTRYDILIKDQNINIAPNIKKIQNLSNNYTISEKLLYNTNYDNIVKQDRAFALSIIVLIVIGFFIFLSLTKSFSSLEKENDMKREDNDKYHELKEILRGLKTGINKIESKLEDIGNKINIHFDNIGTRQSIDNNKELKSTITTPLEHLKADIKYLNKELDDLKKKIDELKKK
jgi:hypothetical protein